MNEQEVIIWALLGGSLGGFASFMLVAYDQFSKIPTVAQAEEAKKSLRKTYLILRVIFGLVCAFIFAFWFMDSALDGSLSQSKLTFYSAIVGFSTSILPTVSKGVVKLISKSTGSDGSTG